MVAEGTSEKNKGKMYSLPSLTFNQKWGTTFCNFPPVKCPTHNLQGQSPVKQKRTCYRSVKWYAKIPLVQEETWSVQQEIWGVVADRKQAQKLAYQKVKQGPR